MTLDPDTLAELSQLALDVATEAGGLASLGFRQPKEVRYKGEIDLVTEFDTRAEALIVDRLQRRTPEIAIVGEEGGGAAGALTWYVDPIDGTTNYAHGHPFWCVSIGLVERVRHEARPVAGAVVAPALGISWRGTSSLAFRNGEPCCVSATAELEKAFLASGFPYDRKTSPENNFATFVALKKRAQGIRRCGSAALDLCLVADGTYDGYWERKLKPWDLAAGAALVLGGGGMLTDFTGSPPDIATGYLVATNGPLHPQLLQAIAESEGQKTRG